MLAEVFEKYTYEDYKRWEGDWELIEGFPIAMAPSPVITHQLIAFNIAFEQKKNKSCKECEVVLEEDWIIDEYNIVRPDIAFICDINSDFIKKAPEVVVEVVSKSSVKIDEKVKFELYEKERVKYYILAYPSLLKARVFKLNNNKYEKIGDFTDEKINLDDIKCPSEIDFNAVFERFRSN